ncbi:MAG: hypothetical protein JW870_15560, partial [Candidatus Delongbacteria bacterium]|nr:hypothetical protein [Candidatus Delongbacteria bacterium]
MSDIAIPGFSSDSNSAKMIENLLKAKRIPLEKLESTQEEYTNIKGVWQDLRVTFSKLSDSTSKLFGFENPFNEKTVSSTNEEILTAESERSAIDENLSFNIKKLASTDKFVSKQIDENFRIPEGTYKFIISEDEITLKYRGGTAEDFVEKLNKRNPDNLRASLIKNSKTTQVLLIESLKTGKENKLEFNSDSIDLGLKLGIIEKNIVENSQIKVDDIIESKGNVDKSEYKLNLSPLSNASFRVKDELNESDIVEITVELVDKNDSINNPNLPLNDLIAPSVTLENITINSEPGKQLDRFLTNDESELPPILDMNVVSVNSGVFDFELEPIINK